MTGANEGTNATPTSDSLEIVNYLLRDPIMVESLLREIRTAENCYHRIPFQSWALLVVQSNSNLGFIE